MRILQTVREAGRALVIAFNKWDLVDEERRYYLEREIERELVQVQWAPRINVTARTGWHVDRLVPALDKALEGWETRVTTGALNSFLGRLVAEHPHPVRSGKQPKILFGTQPSTAPPTFVLFTSGKLDAGYERFIERRLREEFGFVGTPIVLQQRPAGEAQALASGRMRPPSPSGCRLASSTAVGPRRRRARPAAGPDAGRSTGRAGRRHVLRRRSRRTTTGAPTSATCPATAQQAVAARHMSTGGRPAPRLRAVVRRRARTTASRSRSSATGTAGAGEVRLRRARATRSATRSARTPGSRAAALRRRQARDHRRHGRPAGSTRPAHPRAGRPAGGRAPARSGSLSSNALRPDGWTSADAAGLPILPGLLRWNEVRDRRRQPRDPVHHRRHLAATTSGRPATTPARGQPQATRRWAPGSG